MKWVEIQIKTTTEALEAVSNILYESGVGGVVIEDSPQKLDIPEEDGWKSLTDLTDIEFEGVVVKGYLPMNSSIHEKIKEIQKAVDRLTEYNLDKGLGEVVFTEISEENWANSWKKYYKPIKIGQKIVIKPTWKKYAPKEGEIVVQIDPGMAFGTGTHETTVMCIKLLQKYVFPDSVVIDVGCGSGILSIVSAKLGAKKVIGVDADKVAVDVAKKNVVRNNEENKINIIKGNLLDDIHEKADIVVANITADVIMELAQDIGNNIRSAGVFIASGIIKGRSHDVKKSLEKNGFDIKEEIEESEWYSYVATFPSV